MNSNAHSSLPNSDSPADEQTIDLKPEEDLITLNALGHALRVDPARVRRWVEDATLGPDLCSRAKTGWASVARYLGVLTRDSAERFER